MDAGVAEPITRWLGVSITLVGAFIVSPAATVALIGRWQRRTVWAVRRVEGAVRKLIGRPRRNTGQFRSLLPAMEASGAGTVTWKGMAAGEAPDLSVEGRLDRLEKRAAAAEAVLVEARRQAEPTVRSSARSWVRRERSIALAPPSYTHASTTPRRRRWS